MELVIYFAILISVTTAILLITRNTRYFPGVLAAACTYWLFMAAGTYHIFISRGSTSGIGFLFIPFYCLLPALVGALGVTLTTQKANWIRALGGLVLAGLIPMASFALQGIVETQQTNAKRDAQRKAHYEAYVGYRKQLRDHPDRYPAEKLVALIETKKERAFLLAVASWKDTPDIVLKKLVDQDDGGILLSLLRHPRTPMSAIDKAVRLNQHHYFSRDLAANSQTPRDILLSLVSNISKNVGIGRALVQNPNVDCDILHNLLEHEHGSMTSYRRETRALAHKRLEAECQ